MNRLISSHSRPKQIVLQARRDALVDAKHIMNDSHRANIAAISERISEIDTEIAEIDDQGELQGHFHEEYVNIIK